MIAYDICIDGIYYNINTETLSAEVTSGNEKYMGIVNIPPFITHNGADYRVIGIGEKAFYDCINLSHIEMAHSITYIGGNAFCWCTGLTSVVLSENLTSIDWYAFGYCNNLHFISIPNTIQSIGHGAFSGCSHLESFVLPEGLDTIPQFLFEYCDNLESLFIPEGVRTVGASSCGYCVHLTSLYLPSSIQSIDFSAFAGCSALKEVFCYAKEIPSGNTDIFEASPIDSATLYVPASALSLYQSTTPWSEFGNIMAMETDETETNIKTMCPHENTNKYFTINGIQTNTQHKGILLIKSSNGKVKKVLAK